MEAITNQKYLHTSPRKLRLVADMVRKMTPEKAIDILALTPKSAALDLAKVIKTVLASAKQQGAQMGQLSFKLLEINESMKMRRMRAGSRGRAKPYKKRMSHIKIVLSDELMVQSKQKGGKGKEESVKNKEKTSAITHNP